MASPTWRIWSVMVVAVMDGPRLSLASRAVMVLVVALMLLSSGTAAQPGIGGVSPGQPDMQEGPKLLQGFLGGHLPLVRTKAGHGQHNRRVGTPAAMLAATLAGALAGAIRPARAAGSRRGDRQMLALGPRAPPFRS
jgi:hypothetical protein